MSAMTRMFPKKQRGLTLIEIMIALALGLMLIAGLLQLFVGTRQSFRMQENLSRVQESGRYALEYLSRSLRLAGYRARDTIEVGQSFEDKFEVDSNPDRRPIWGVDGGTGTPNPPDVVTVNFEGTENALQGEVRDCLNRQAPADQASRNTLQLNGTDLECVSVVGDPVVTQTQAVLENVIDFQILYGEDTDSNEVANRYVSAGNVGDMNNVVSARVCVALQSDEPNLMAEGVGLQTYQDCSGVNATCADRRLCRIFTTTVTLRNRLL
ncbi:MAG: PilW family protein [Gammaproteobacteria bacterium]|nr:PilW family protein [Gammaproteobacteria bacterium]MCP5423865.1 PilW family protein [Gammaproteobacteria bacterium]